MSTIQISPIQQQDEARRFVGLSRESYERLPGDPWYCKLERGQISKAHVLVMYERHLQRESIMQDKERRQAQNKTKRRGL